MKFKQSPTNDNRISLENSDGSIVFEIRVVDGHSIEVLSFSSSVRDGMDIYESSLSILPHTSDTVVISRNRWEG